MTTFEIDQSGKIEQTAKDTILCLSNHTWYAVRISAHAKRQLQEIFRRNGQIRNFVLFTFCAGLAILIRKSKILSTITIDEEYSGKNHSIKAILLEMFSNLSLNSDITFRRIGKQSSAHLHAKEVATGKQKPTTIITTEALLKIIKKTEVGKRLKGA